MAWVAKDSLGVEWIFDGRPKRSVSWNSRFGKVLLPQGTIKKLIGKEMSWEDDPIELKKDIV